MPKAKPAMSSPTCDLLNSVTRAWVKRSSGSGVKADRNRGCAATSNSTVCWWGDVRPWDRFCPAPPDRFGILWPRPPYLPHLLVASCPACVGWCGAQSHSRRELPVPWEAPAQEPTPSSTLKTTSSSGPSKGEPTQLVRRRGLIRWSLQSLASWHPLVAGGYLFSLLEHPLGDL